MTMNGSSTIKVTITLPKDLNQSLINLAALKKQSKSSVATSLIKIGLNVALAPTESQRVLIEHLL